MKNGFSPDIIFYDPLTTWVDGTSLLAGESDLNDNPLHPSYLTLQPCSTDLDAQGNSKAANPFFGIITNPSSALRTATVQRRQLLRPFPQYDAVNAFRVPLGSSIYHGGTRKADKRFSNSASFPVAYTGRKLLDEVSTRVDFMRVCQRPAKGV